HMLVDKAAMELACNPHIFDVILTTSIFGDILSDEAGVTTGSVGMLPSASLNENNFGLYEPIHGTAPDIDGMGIANPLATIASVGMMLEIALNLSKEAGAIDRAIHRVLHDGYRTPDIYMEGTKKVTTVEMGTLTADRISKE
ncbi:MAG TPA: isocitrate/isopropylmalate family dehydrogenase, partial [Syntrophorhabdaceae bacterium]|nr:isocitrate/isopropylmalate family dehydrogenase [Syntrophorhabdaceae bacterium]